MLFGSVGLSAADTADWTWPQWRGGNQDGVAEIGGVPVSWQADARGNGQGIAWKTDLPGRGGSTPVIADGKAFLTAGFDGYNHLLAIDVAGGKIRWDVKAGEDQGNKHQKGSGSNPSAVTDGDLQVALDEISALPDAAMPALSDWVAQATTRIAAVAAATDLAAALTAN